jgi:hypothetical protein
MTHKWDAFISYCHSDLRVAELISKDIVNTGLSVWQDVLRLELGGSLRNDVIKAIRNSSVFVLLLSPSSFKSKWVMKELDAAMTIELNENRAFVIPVLLGRIDLKTIPLDLQAKYCLDLRYDFPRKYKAKRERFLKIISLIAHALPRASQDNKSMSLGEEFMHYLINYKEAIPEQRNISQIAGKALFEAVSENIDIYPEIKDLWQEFRTEFGHYYGEKVSMFSSEKSRFPWMTGFTEAQMDHFIHETTILMGAMLIAKETIPQGIDIRISEKDDELVFWAEKII